MLNIWFNDNYRVSPCQWRPPCDWRPHDFPIQNLKFERLHWVGASVYHVRQPRYEVYLIRPGLIHRPGAICSLGSRRFAQAWVRYKFFPYDNPAEASLTAALLRRQSPWRRPACDTSPGGLMWLYRWVAWAVNGSCGDLSNVQLDIDDVLRSWIQKPTSFSGFKNPPVFCSPPFGKRPSNIASEILDMYASLDLGLQPLLFAIFWSWL